MTTLYADIGPSIVDTFVDDPYFSLLAALPTLYRPTPGSPAVALASVGTRPLSIVPAGGPRDTAHIAAIATWQAPFYAMADAAADVQAGDVVSDGQSAYQIKEAPLTWIGFLLAPAEPYPVAELPSAGVGTYTPIGLLLSLTRAA